MSKNLIKRAKIFATNAHAGQVRKYTGDPYIVHPVNVANIVKSVKHTDSMICAALLHDVVEDTDVTLNDINYDFGSCICKMVEMLTDVSKKSDGNRFIRRKIDLAHTALATPKVKTIKLADLIDNTHSIVKYDKEFARVYLQEKLNLLEVLKEGNTELWNRAKVIAEEGLILCT